MSPARIPTLLAALAAALAAAPALAEGVDEGLANVKRIETARNACIGAAKARGLDVKKVDRIRLSGDDLTTVKLEISGRGDVECEYTASTQTASLPDGLGGLGGLFGGTTGGGSKDAGRNPIVRACQVVAEKKDIRLGEFDEQRDLPGRKIEIRFDRPFFGQRHDCVYDPARQTVAFDGGEPVPVPAAKTAPSK
jgi:hypothetical protein